MNGKLPRLRIGRAEPWQRERLARWLAEWELEQDLPIESRVIGGNKRPVDKTLPVAPLEAEPAVTPGQVRLLSPEIPVAANRPVYLAVLSNQGANAFLVAPYSSFAEPAFPGEFVTGREAPPLSVLCAWNAGAVDARVLAKSWLVDELSAHELDEALSVLRHVRDGASLSPELERRSGPPLWHPADPRETYRSEAAALMRALADDEGAQGRGNPGSGPLIYPTGSGQLPLAAEPRAKYETRPAPDDGESA